MLCFIAFFAAASLSTVLAQSKAHVDSSTGITFQRVQNTKDGSSVAIALPPQGASANDAIVQMTGPISQGFSGISPAPNLQSFVLLTCCWCCTRPSNDARSLPEKSSARKPMFASRHLVAGHSEPKAAVEPVLTQLREPEITSMTYKVTFRCQNCTFTEAKGSVLTTLSIVSSNNNPSSILDPELKFDPASDVRNVQFDLSAARFADYWAVVEQL
ncbi:hypothetical protein BDZ97DRAFT_1921586 [Flammula alnicola]|nr:hypothetical protein BDZ97DRAFT_1921586 [Flammula alnicola]